jgi:hypothetical protein
MQIIYVNATSLQECIVNNFERETFCFELSSVIAYNKLCCYNNYETKSYSSIIFLYCSWFGQIVTLESCKVTTLLVDHN